MAGKGVFARLPEAQKKFILAKTGRKDNGCLEWLGTFGTDNYARTKWRRNPDHMKIGTNAENSQHMRDSSRSIRGDKNHFAKLTWDDVEIIRNSKIPATKIAPLFGMSVTGIGLIRRNKTWRVDVP